MKGYAITEHCAPVQWASSRLSVSRMRGCDSATCVKMMYLSSFHNNRGYGYADITVTQCKNQKLFTWHTVKKISLSNNERNNFARGITSVWPVNQKNLDEIAAIVRRQNRNRSCVNSGGRRNSRDIQRHLVNLSVVEFCTRLLAPDTHASVSKCTHVQYLSTF